MTLTPLPPVVPAAPEGPNARIAAALAERSARVIDAARRVRKQGDPEAIHDLRVASRRLEASLRLWSQALDPAAADEARSALRRVRRRLGRTREREVLLDMVQALAGRDPGLAEALEAEAARLARRVARGRARAARGVRPGRLTTLDGCLARAHASVRGPAPAALRAGRAELDSRRREALDAVENAQASSDLADLHSARVAIKKWRYAGESLAFATPVPREVLANLRVIQQALGAVNDAVVLRDYLTRRATRLRTKGLPTRAASLERARSWAETEARRARARFAESWLGSGLSARS